MSRTYFHGSKCVLAIEFLLFFYKSYFFFFFFLGEGGGGGGWGGVAILDRLTVSNTHIQTQKLLYQNLCASIP